MTKVKNATHLQCVFLSCTVEALHHFAIDAETKHVRADLVDVRYWVRVHVHRPPRGACERHQHLVDVLETIRQARLLVLPDSFLAKRDPKRSLDLGLPPLPACSSGFIQCCTGSRGPTGLAAAANLPSKAGYRDWGARLIRCLPSWLYSVHRLN